jgi:hypothetical protein
MRIARQTLNRRWAAATTAAVLVFAVLAILDQRLKALSGYSTFDLQKLSAAWQYRPLLVAWAPVGFGLRAGFNLGLDYLFMPLYAAAFFLSGIVAREGFTRPGSRPYRIATLLSAVPIAGAFLDAGENAAEAWMLLTGATNTVARIAFTLSSAKTVAIYIGLLLLAGAILARVQARQQAKKPPESGA